MTPAFYSQFGEDRKLAKIFAGAPAICVEVGANDGVQGSNTLHFEELGWTCVLIEPNPKLCEKLRQRRTGIIHECAVSNEPGEVTLHIVEGPEGADGMSTASSDPADHARFKALGFTSHAHVVACSTLDQVLEASGIEKPIGFVSIDVEGLELQVLQGFALDRWKPRVLLIEDNSSARDNLVSDYLRRRGYRRFDRTGVNDWYGRAEDAALVNAGSRLRTSFLRAVVPLSRKMLALPPGSVWRKLIRRVPGARALHRKLPF